MVKLKDLFSKNLNKNTKQVSYCLKKRLVREKGIDMDKLMKQEIKFDNDDIF